MKRYGLILAAVVAMAGPVDAESNIDPANRFAWAENVGWLNWRDAADGHEGVRLHATYLSGWIWSENIGWIHVGDGSPGGGTAYGNVDGSDYGVNVAANGDLSGYAWAENAGWLNFDTAEKGDQRARLDRAAGRFRGYAWGENIGWVNLDDAAAYVAVRVASPGDFDADGDVDLADFFLFQTCFNGPNRPPASVGCTAADMDGDTDVDLADFTSFQACFNGPNRVPACE